MTKLNESPEKIYVDKCINGYINLESLNAKSAKQIIEFIETTNNTILNLPGVNRSVPPVFHFEQEYNNIDCYITAQVLETDEEFQKRQIDLDKKIKVRKIIRKNRIDKLIIEAKELGLVVTNPEE